MVVIGTRKWKRPFRIMLLLLSLVLITTVGAAVYNLLYMEANISAEAPKVYFVEGADGGIAGAYLGTNGTYVKFTSMAGWPNATRYYENATAIKNADNGPRNIVLSFVSWSGDTTYVTIAVKVFNSSDVQQGSTINIGTPGSSTGTLSIPAGAVYRVQWEIKWNAGASSSYKVSVTLRLRVDE